MRFLGMAILFLAFAGCQEAVTTEQTDEPAAAAQEEQAPAEEPTSEGSGTEESEGSGTEQKEQE